MSVFVITTSEISVSLCRDGQILILIQSQRQILKPIMENIRTIICSVQVTQTTEEHHAGGFEHQMLIYTVEFKAQPFKPF